MIKINLIKEMKKTAPVDDEHSSQFNFDNLFSIMKSSKENDEDEIEFRESDNIVQVLIKLLFIFAGIGGLYYHESVNIPLLEGQLAGLQKQTEELVQYNQKASKAVAEIKKAQEYKEVIQKQIDTLAMLSQVRLNYIKVIDLIQTSVTEKIWFTQLSASGKTMDLSGVSYSENEITTFLDTIGKSRYLSDVSLLSSEDIQSIDPDVKKFKRFNINIQLEGQ